MDHYKTLIFDLGNVLISFSHKKMYDQIAHLCGMSTQTLKKIFIDHSIEIKYEKGLLSSHEITSILSKQSGKILNYKKLMQAGNDIFSYRPEMIDLLNILKKNGYQLILLSNTNEAHYQFIKNEFNFFKLFDHIILSYEVGSRKPEKKIFEYALKNARGFSFECFYIDDVPEYIQAAKALGIKGHTFKSPSNLYHELHFQGILT